MHAAYLHIRERADPLISREMDMDNEVVASLSATAIVRPTDMARRPCWEFPPR